MPSWTNTPPIGQASAVNVPTTSETVVATAGPINCDLLEYVVDLEGYLDITIGTATTTLTIKLERGTAAGGTLVTYGGTWGPFTVTAGNRANFSVMGQDRPPTPSTYQYVMTVTQVSATGNGTANVAFLFPLTTSPN